MSERLTHILEILHQIEKQSQEILDEWERGKDAAAFSRNAYVFSAVLANICRIVPQEIYAEYQNFFESFCIFCGQCRETDFIQAHMDDFSWLWSV